jgi:hypothetical protein
MATNLLGGANYLAGGYAVTNVVCPGSSRGLTARGDERGVLHTSCGEASGGCRVEKMVKQLEVRNKERGLIKMGDCLANAIRGQFGLRIYVWLQQAKRVAADVRQKEEAAKLESRFEWIVAKGKDKDQRKDRSRAMILLRDCLARQVRGETGLRLRVWRSQMHAVRGNEAHAAMDFLCRICELEDRMNLKVARLVEDTAKECEKRVIEAIMSVDSAVEMEDSKRSTVLQQIREAFGDLPFRLAPTLHLLGPTGVGIRGSEQVLEDAWPHLRAQYMYIHAIQPRSKELQLADSADADADMSSPAHTRRKGPSVHLKKMTSATRSRSITKNAGARAVNTAPGGRLRASRPAYNLTALHPPPTGRPPS